MKSQFLKIAGVKSEKAFYKKYPTEAAFFKAHPEAKKMANGGEQDKGQIQKLQQLTDFGNPPIAQFGLNLPDPFGFGKTNSSLNTQGLKSLGVQQPTDFGKYIGGMGQSKRAGANSYGQMFGNFQTGKNLSTGIKNPIGAAGKLKGADLFGKIDKFAGKAAPYVGAATDIIEGVGMIKQQKNALKQAKQDKALTDVFRQAAFSSPVDIEKRQYIRPEDYIYQPEQMFPSYGVGTNVLAQDGAMIGGNPTEIQNTFAPNTIYTDMGYEPLNDSDRLKAYYYGGKMRKAQGGFSAALNSGGFGDFMTEQGGGDLLGGLTNLTQGKRGPSAGNKIGSGVLGGIGTAFGGPVGGMIGKALGSVIGGLFDKTGKKIDALEEQSNQNVSDIMYSKAGVGLQNQYSSYMEDGGYVSNDWTPQVIATFGEYKLKDLLQPPNDADMLRAGGHIRGGYTPPSERAMQTYAMGGDLQVYRGEAETMSYNPYLPDGGETVMFRGPSHDDGGMPIEYGSSPVEVEGGEPAVKLQDGTSGDSSLVVYGNLVNPKTGKKFKRDAAEISKNEAKQNKNIDRASKGLDNLDVNTSFDKLGLDTYNAMITGANMKLKQYAEDKMDLAAMQSAINDTAEEYSLIADDLAKGRVKPDTSKDATAKYGTSLPKAAAGTEINPIINTLLDLIKQKGYDYNVTSTVRKGAKTAQGRPSRHSVGEAADLTFPKLGSEAYNTILKDPEIAQFMLENGLTAINEYDSNTLAATKGTGPHIHFGFDKGTGASDKFRTDASALYGNPSTQKQGAPVSAEDYTYLQGLYEAAKKQKKGPAVEKFQKEFSRISPEFAKQVLGQYPVTSFGKSKGLKVTDLSSNIDSIFGPRTERYMNSLNIAPAKGVGVTNQGTPSTTPLIPLPTSTSIPLTTGQITTKFPFMDLINSYIGQRRRSNAEPLDKQQLIPEMYSLISNDLEPVYAQKINPRLQQPYDISLQDQMNANQADFNSILRATGGDPSAASSLAAQKYAANSKVLGEQMRINQANKANIYNTNIQTMNAADVANQIILDEQYVRQAKAKSNTKATTLAALESITDKYAQNKLTNRNLATYENLYNYRYDPSFRAQNMNPLQKFNMPTVTNKLPIYDAENNIIGYQQADGSAPAPATPPYVAPGSRKTTETKEQKPKSEVSRNGSIVKALKNL